MARKFNWGQNTKWATPPSDMPHRPYTRNQISPCLCFQYSPSFFLRPGSYIIDIDGRATPSTRPKNQQLLHYNIPKRRKKYFTKYHFKQETNQKSRHLRIQGLQLGLCWLPRSYIPGRAMDRQRSWTTLSSGGRLNELTCMFPTNW